MASDENEFNSEVLQTFVKFLSKSSPVHVRGIAMDYLLGCTGTKEGSRFVAENPICLTSVIDLMDDEEISIARNAYKSLINLTAEIEVAAEIARLPNFSSFVTSVIKSCLSDSSSHSYNASKIASNLSRWEECSTAIKTLFTSGTELNMYAVVEGFSKFPERLEYLANFLSNMSCQQEIRRLLLDKNRCVVQRLLPLLACESSVVRQGVAGTLRNCCFETDHHEWLLSNTVDVLPRLLLPLAGPEEFDDDDMEKLPDDLQYLGEEKTREPEASIRQMLVETVNKLCATKPCRQYIRDKNTYVIIRELHKWEKSSEVSTAIENLVSVLISDEPEEGMENLDTVEIPEDVESKLKSLAENAPENNSVESN